MAGPADLASPGAADAGAAAEAQTPAASARADEEEAEEEEELLSSGRKRVSLLEDSFGRLTKWRREKWERGEKVDLR